MFGFGVGGFAEAECVHVCDGACAHGEDVAKDATHAGGRALEGLDVAWVVVAFHFENGGLAVADVDDACVFTGTADDPWGFGGQGAQVHAGGFIRAVFAPHDGENAELYDVWLAVFLGRQAVFGDDFGSDGLFFGG